MNPQKFLNQLVQEIISDWKPFEIFWLFFICRGANNRLCARSAIAACHDIRYCRGDLRRVCE